jgi:hypothetical protein
MKKMIPTAPSKRIPAGAVFQFSMLTLHLRYESHLKGAIKRCATKLDREMLLGVKMEAR